MTKSEDRRGKRGQNIAAACLSQLGIEMVEKIGTPVKLIPMNAEMARKGIYKVIFESTVSGDHRGIIPGGISVLAETKTIYDRNLRWSDLRDHQPAALQSHCDFGGLSLLVWVNGESYDDVFVMMWPIIGFMPGKSIGLDQARFEHQTTKHRIYKMIGLREK